MSMLSNLESHDKNMWGRYSSPSANAGGGFSDNPENDVVQLITLSPLSSRRTRSSVLQNLKKPKTIEILDDHSQCRSNTDKNPEHFNAQKSNFTIPKTKQQTENEKSNSPTKKSNSQRKVRTQLALVSEGRNLKRDNTSEDNPRRKLRRPWLYAKNPQSSDGVQQNDGDNSKSPTVDKLVVKRNSRSRRNSHPPKADTPVLKKMAVCMVDLKNSSNSELSDEHEKSPGYKTRNRPSGLIETPESPTGPRYPLRQREEIRCQLCNDIIDEAGCFTCPKTSDEEFPELYTTYGEISEDRFLVPASDPPESRVSPREEREQLEDNEQTTGIEQVNIVSSESQESDVMDEVTSSNITQDDIFCSLCGEARSKAGCGCPDNSGEHSTSMFYSRHRNSAFNKLGSRSLGGVSKVAKKRKRSSLTMKKKTKAKSTEPKQTKLDMKGQTKRLADVGKTQEKKIVPLPQKPECVHISSDEEEILDSVKSDNAEDMEDENVRVSSEHPTNHEESQGSLDDFVTSRKKPGYVNGVVLKQKGRKQKKTAAKVPTYLDEEDPYVLVTVKNVMVGELTCTPREPVEVRPDKIHIKVTYDDENLDFKLEKDNIASFKIHVEDEPLIMMLKTTPGWARKYIERYDKFGIYIDPGSNVYMKKHIMFVLSESIVGDKLDALVEMIDYHLCEEPIVERMSQSDAEAEGVRIISSAFSGGARPEPSAVPNEKRTKSPPIPNETRPDLPAVPNKTRPKSSLSGPPEEASDDLSSTTKHAPVVYKTYSTRSKTSVPAPKTPSKTILVYQPLSKMSGVTITNEDLLCLSPSTYLNDVIIDFFLKYLIEEVLTIEQRETLHLFSTFFYARLTQKNVNSDEPRSPMNMHRNVKSWTKNVDIFSKDFLIIPINESAHWILVIICHPRKAADAAVNEESDDEKDSEMHSDEWDDFDRTLLEGAKKNGKRRKSRENTGPAKERPCILIFDSLGNHRRSSVMTNLRKELAQPKFPTKESCLPDDCYLNCEWRERKDNSAENIFNKDTIKGCYPKVPLQENFSDCGLYVLQYFERFFTNPIEDYKSPIDLLSWFSHDEMKRKRKDIIDVIFKLQANQESINDR